MQRDIIEVWAGEQRTIPLIARTPAQAVKDLTGYTLSFRIMSRVNDGFSQGQYTGTVTDAATGAYTVTLTEADTQYMSGDYSFITYATSASVPIAVNVGTLRVNNGARV